MRHYNCLQCSSVQSLSHIRLYATPWTAARQASLSITIFWVHSDPCPSSQWCHPALSSSVVPFSSCPQSLRTSGTFPMSQLFTWGGQNTGISASASFLPKKSQGWSPSEWTGLDLLAVQGTLKNLLQHHSSKTSVLWHSAFFTVQLSHPYMTTGKTVALTRRTFVGKVMSLLFNMLSRLVITFLPRVSVFQFHGCSHHLQWFSSPITTNCVKFLEKWEYQTTWPASWEICMQVRKQRLEQYME